MFFICYEILVFLYVTHLRHCRKPYLFGTYCKSYYYKNCFLQVIEFLHVSSKLYEFWFTVHVKERK